MTKTSIGLALTFSVVLIQSEPQSGERCQNRPSDISCPREALDMAFAYTEFDKLSSLQIRDTAEHVCMITVHDSTMPFVSDSVYGCRAWQLTFQNVLLDLNRTSANLEHRHLKSVRAELDSTTGRLLEVSIAEQDKSSCPPVVVPASVAQRQLQNMLFEEYTGLPDTIPSVSLLAALNGRLFGSPVTSDCIVVSYVLHRMNDGPPRPAWVIHLYGLGSLPGGATHMRNVIDAFTGELITASSLPAILYPEDSTRGLNR